MMWRGRNAAKIAGKMDFFKTILKLIQKTATGLVRNLSATTIGRTRY
jgi:hypothetical protein